MIDGSSRNAGGDDGGEEIWAAAKKKKKKGERINVITKSINCDYVTPTTWPPEQVEWQQLQLQATAMTGSGYRQ